MEPHCFFAVGHFVAAQLFILLYYCQAHLGEHFQERWCVCDAAALAVDNYLEVLVGVGVGENILDELADCSEEDGRFIFDVSNEVVVAFDVEASALE